MNILIIAATSFELSPIQIHPNHSIETFITGVGLSQTAYALGNKLHSFKADLCIQIGIAGSYDRSLSIGEAVIVKQDCFADLGANDRDGSFMHLTEFLPCNPLNPFEQAILEPSMPALQTSLVMVNAISVNTVHGHQQAIDQVIRKYNPQIETMEGASFFAVCMTLGVPCIQLRSISNYVEPRDRASWNIGLAIKNLHQALKELLESM
jgi:futalosine hydrolase